MIKLFICYQRFVLVIKNEFTITANAVQNDMKVNRTYQIDRLPMWLHAMVHCI